MANGGGWIKLHRKILDNPVVCKDAETLSIWIFMLLSAAHDETDVVFKGERITLKAGQFISSIRTIADKLCIDRGKVHRVITLFESEPQIVTQKSNKNTLFTIKKWREYQNAVTQDVTQVRHDCDTTVTQNKNEKKDVYIVSNETIVAERNAEKSAVEEWNKMATVSGLPVVTKLATGSKREKLLKARLNQYGLDEVLKAIRMVGDSPFLQGKVKDFSADFEWVMKPNNFPKVLEGNYLDRRAAKNGKDAIDDWF